MYMEPLSPSVIEALERAELQAAIAASRESENRRANALVGPSKFRGQTFNSQPQLPHSPEPPTHGERVLRPFPMPKWSQQVQKPSETPRQSQQVRHASGTPSQSQQGRYASGTPKRSQQVRHASGAPSQSQPSGTHRQAFGTPNQSQLPQRQSATPTLSATSRVEASNSSNAGRLRISSVLNRIMKLLEGCCPYHFVFDGAIQAHPYCDSCPGTDVVTKAQWASLKKTFTFERYAYCFYCGFPQDRNRNGEAPSCHRTFGYTQRCPWADFIFITLTLLWEIKEYRIALLLNFGLPENTSFNDYLDWINGEDLFAGEYYKGLMAFIWFCEQRLGL
jgi:hypothetical protein